jgi:hypothetical protein
MLHGFPSIEDTWSTRECLFETETCTESMQQGLFQDINRCLQFSDGWDKMNGVD